jgi:hypothetical protein
VKRPTGTTTISGQAAHSLKTSFGLSAHSSSANNGVAARDDTDTATEGRGPPHGEPGRTGGATAAIVWIANSTALQGVAVQ